MSNQITPNPSVPSQVVAEVKFPRWINNLGIIPTSYKDSMSYYECLAWLCKFLEETVIPSVNENGEAVEELQNLYIELNSYVDHYFDTLDVQEEINNKLDEMAENGSLYALITRFTTPIIEEQNNHIQEAIEEQNNHIQEAIEEQNNHIQEVVDFQNTKIDNNSQNIINNANSITTLSNQIGNIISHNQDVSSNSELIDIRTEFDGTVASSAGLAVRNQVSYLDNRINTSNSNISENKIKLYYGLDGFKNTSFQNGAENNGLNTGILIPEGNSGFSSFVCYFLNFRSNSRLERYVGKTIKFTLKYSYTGDDLYANTQSTQLKLRSWDGLNTYTTVDGDQSHVTSSVSGNVITKSINWTITNDTKYLGVLFQLMAQTAVDEDTTITIIENTYEVIDSSLTNNTNALYQTLIDKNTNTNLTVKKDGTGDFYTLKSCFDYINSKGDNNENNIYNVYIYSGIYDLYTEQGGLTWVNNISISNGERQGLTIPSYVRLIGVGYVELTLQIPDSVTNTDAFRCVSLLNCKKWNEIYNIKMKSRNVRYTVHDEASGDFGKTHRIWKNCIFQRLTGRTDIFSTTNYGGGLGSGGTYDFINCIFLNDGTNLFIHNNNMIEPNIVTVDGCYLKSNIYGHSINFGYTGSNTSNSIAIVKNCMYNDVANIIIAEGSTNAWDIYNYVDNTVTISGQVQS